MKHLTSRRLAILALLLGSQALSACIILPLPHHRHRVIVGEPQQDYRAYPERDQRDRRDRREYR